MLTCQYCGVSYESFQSICPQCGAPTQIEKEISPEELKAKIIADRVRLICHKHPLADTRDFKVGESISDKKIEKMMKNFRVFPIGKEIFLFCDTSSLRNGKRGFIICEDGIYWHNSWATSTNRNFLPWKVFKEREISIHKRFDLDLEKGDLIELSGLGSDALRKTVEELFRHIQKSVNDEISEKELSRERTMLLASQVK